MPAPRVRKFLIAVSLAFCGLPTGMAKDWYVDNVRGDDRWNGSPTRAGGEREGPLKTLGRALEGVIPGDRIVLTKTTMPYHECVTLAGERHSGSPLTPFVIEGNGAILDGSRPTEEFDWRLVGGEIFQLPLKKSEYQQLFLDGKPALRVPREANRAAMDLKPLEWRLDEGRLLFRTEPTRIPQDYKPSVAIHTAAFTLYHVRHVLIRDLIVQGYQLDGIQAHDAGSGGPIVLADVTARGNGRSGIAVVGASEVAIDGCLVGNNGRAQIFASGPADARITNSTILDNTAPPFVIENGAEIFDEGKRQSPAK
ncbi:MAG: right-handed parallel beta-helix repeat-containing protein [Pirellulales bacterium]